MTARLYLLIALVSLASIAWLGIHYQFEKTELIELQELSSYPIYAYVADTSMVSPLISELSRFPELDSLRIETGFEAGRELVDTYSLPVGEDLLATFVLPDIITLRFLPLPKARHARQNVLSTLYQYLPEQDVDSQSTAWLATETKLNHQIYLKYAVDILIGLLLIGFCVHSRIGFEQKVLLLHKRRLVTVVDFLRFKASSRNHSLMLFFIPLILSLGLYLLFAWQGMLQWLIPYWFMGAFAGTHLIAAIVIMTLLNLMDHDTRLYEREHSVSKPRMEPDREA